jgi:glucans biosynthesis protein
MLKAVIVFQILIITDRENGVMLAVCWFLMSCFYSYLRRSLWVVCMAGVVICTQLLRAEAADSFSYQNAVDKARQLAAKPYQNPAGQVPDFLLKIDYDAWRDIRFKPDQALWRTAGLPFQVQFFHPGLYYDRPVKINIVDFGAVKPVAFSRDLFDYGKNSFKNNVPVDLGFAGFRLHFQLNTKKYYDEVAVFLGASNFRAVAKKQRYGLSARGLAIDTALSTGEEFPYFREFWIVKPVEESTRITVYALLDSPSLSGAYQFVIKPGRETVMDVQGTLFQRKKVQKIGIAPLTSMFFYGENISQRPVDDFRAEVHDTDGLLIAFSTGEWLWHPLVNPRALIINSFKATDPVGFGLMQRDLDFNSYQDLEAGYESKPGVWITPRGKWGAGHIELIQIPTSTELNDNIFTFWVPEQRYEVDKPVSFSYAMSWQHPGKSMPPAGRVIATRTAKGRDDQMKRFIVDFAGGKLPKLAPDTPVVAVVSVDSNAKLVEKQVYKNSFTGGWRLAFQIKPEEQPGMDLMLSQKRPPIELRAYLKESNNILTETWSYTYLP